MADVKRCAHCGSPFIEWVKLAKKDDRDPGTVQCMNPRCHACTWGSDKPKIIAAWNKRVKREGAATNTLIESQEDLETAKAAARAAGDG